MQALIGDYQQLGWVALKAALMFAVAVVGLRVAERRTLAQLSVFDLVVAVAIGAIVGRTATSSTTSLITGATALITLLGAHRIVAILHRRGVLNGLLSRRPVALLDRGRVQTHGLNASDLTRGDLLRLLRQAGHTDLTRLQYVLFEDRGALTVITRDAELGEPARVGLAEAGIDPDELDPDGDAAASQAGD